MRSAEELRVEARQLLTAAEKIADPEAKQKMAARPLGLSERAEAIANSAGHPELLRANIAKYQAMPDRGITDPLHKSIVEEMLADAISLLGS
jgi:hypothetical protein